MSISFITKNNYDSLIHTIEETNTNNESPKDLAMKADVLAWKKNEIQNIRNSKNVDPEAINQQTHNIEKAAKTILALWEQEKNPEIKKTSIKFIDYKLTSLPDCIKYLQKISDINIGGNAFDKLPYGITQLENLTYLRCNSNERINFVTPDIKNLKNLKNLEISSLESSTFPKEIFELKNLEYLNSDFSFENNVPEEIGNLIKLKTLCLGGENSSKLPDKIENLTKLEKLVIHDTNLTFYPKSIKNIFYHANQKDSQKSTRKMGQLKSVNILKKNPDPNSNGGYFLNTLDFFEFSSDKERNEVQKYIEHHYGNLQPIYDILEKYGMVESDTLHKMPAPLPAKAPEAIALAQPSVISRGIEDVPIAIPVALNLDEENDAQLPFAVPFDTKPIPQTLSATPVTPLNATPAPVKTENSTRQPAPSVWRAFRQRSFLPRISLANRFANFFQSLKKPFQNLRTHISQYFARTTPANHYVQPINLRVDLSNNQITKILHRWAKAIPKHPSNQTSLAKE